MKTKKERLLKKLKFWEFALHELDYYPAVPSNRQCLDSLKAPKKVAKLKRKLEKYENKN